jgi:hypothetical protein
MRSPLTLVLVGVLVVVGAVPATSSAQPAGAPKPPRDDGRLVTPDHSVGGLTGGDAIGQAWYLIYSLPEAENPFVGNGEPCVRLGRKGEVLVPIGFEVVTCTVPQGTAVLINGISLTCSDVEPPPFFARGKAAQRECAKAALAPFVESIALTVDGGDPVDLQKRRYETFSPQREVQVPAGNIIGVPPGPATITAWGFEAWLTKLPPGRHTITEEAIFNEGSPPHISTRVINVVRRHHDKASN